MTSTITLRTEVTGARPQFGTREVRLRDAALSSAEEFGAVRAREINARPTRRWELSWDEATDGQRRHVEQCFDDSLGGVLTMNFTPLGDVDANAVEVLFVEDTFEAEPVGPFTWRMRATVEEDH